MTHSPVSTRLRSVSLAAAKGLTKPSTKMGGSEPSIWKKEKGARLVVLPSADRVEMNAIGRGVTALISSVVVGTRGRSRRIRIDDHVPVVAAAGSLPLEPERKVHAGS